MKSLPFRRAVLAASMSTLALLAAPGAQAACSVTDTFANAVACADGAGPNDSAAGVNSLIGANNWDDLYGIAPMVSNTLNQYKDNNVLPTDVPASENTLFDVVRTDPAGDESLGKLTFLQAISSPFVLVLKSGSSWAGYVFTSGFGVNDMITFDIPGVRGAGLSHASIWTSTAPIPEPETYALMLAGLGVIGFVARRRRPRD